MVLPLSSLGNLFRGQGINDGSEWFPPLHKYDFTVPQMPQELEVGHRHSDAPPLVTGCLVELHFFDLRNLSAQLSPEGLN